MNELFEETFAISVLRPKTIYCGCSFSENSLSRPLRIDIDKALHSKIVEGIVICAR